MIWHPGDRDGREGREQPGRPVVKHLPGQRGRRPAIIVPRVSSPRTVTRSIRHPADLAVLPFMMVVFIALGALGAGQWKDESGGTQPWAVLLALTSAASFVVLLAIYWTGWLLRGHTEWRESRDTSAL
jgi:hypothetical protein